MKGKNIQGKEKDKDKEKTKDPINKKIEKERGIGIGETRKDKKKKNEKDKLKSLLCPNKKAKERKRKGIKNQEASHRVILKTIHLIHKVQIRQKAKRKGEIKMTALKVRKQAKEKTKIVIERKEIRTEETSTNPRK